MTNNHCLDKDYLNSNSELLIQINETDKILNLKNRIKLTYKENDFTIIELKEIDNI